LERAQTKLPQDFFPPEYDTGWTKEHGRLTRWLLQRASLSPHEPLTRLAGWRRLPAWRECRGYS